VRLLESSAGGRLKPKEHEYLLTVGNGAETLLAFVQSLLNVAKIEAGRVDPYLERVDLAEELRALAAIYEPQAQEKGLRFSVSAPKQLPCKVDLLQFRQMAGNLMSNAVKFTDQGFVEVELKAAGAFAALRVKDSGIGIDPKHQALIFDRFYRVRQEDGAPQRQGSGLGLAIVKGLAEAHGGEVSVESQAGQGAAFTLLLPRAEGGKHA
jgi:signal transduction histidine kinase